MFQILNYIFIDETDFETVSIFPYIGLIVCVLFRPPRYFLTTFCPIHFIENSILLSNALSSVIGNYRLYWQSHHYFSIAQTRFRIDDDKRYNRKRVEWYMLQKIYDEILGKEISFISRYIFLSLIYRNLSHFHHRCIRLVVYS